MAQRASAELLGSFWLVFGGCGSAVLAAGFPELGIGFLEVSLAFGLTVLTMAYAIGHISGCHLNPAVSVGLLAGGRFSAGELLPYVGAQVAGRGEVRMARRAEKASIDPALTMTLHVTVAEPSEVVLLVLGLVVIGCARRL